MIVVDASAALAALFNDGPSRRTLSQHQLHAPHLIDSEVASGVRRRVLAGQLPVAGGWTVVDSFRRLSVTRHPAVTLHERVWQLRDNISAYDATYIALAELLDCQLVTADARLSRAPGISCPVTLVPR